MGFLVLCSPCHHLGDQWAPGSALPGPWGEASSLGTALWGLGVSSSWSCRWCSKVAGWACALGSLGTRPQASRWFVAGCEAL